MDRFSRPAPWRCRKRRGIMAMGAGHNFPPQLSGEIPSIRGGKASPSSASPCWSKTPGDFPRRGLFYVYERRVRDALFAAHDLAVFRCLAQKAALDHPVDFFLKFLGLVGFDAHELGHQAALALFGREVTQQLFARAIVILAQPVDGAIERAAQFC